MFKITMVRLSGLQIIFGSTLAISMLLPSSAAMADRPEGAGLRNGDEQQKKKQKNADLQEEKRKSGRQNGRGDNLQAGHYFNEKRRSDVQTYYHEQRLSRRCPSGLVKKHDGCMPPGHVKHWNRGEYLPRNVVYHSVEPAIQIRLGTPPAGHRLVRVAADILLIAVGTGLVVDAIDDLGR